MQKRYLVEFLFIFFLSVVSGLLFNFISANGTSLLFTERKWEKGEIISLEDAYKLYHIKQAVFLDVRSNHEYENGHIPGAVIVPVSGPIETKLNTVDKFARDMPIVTYCQNAKCPSSKRLAELLIQFGFENVLIFKAGWDEWEKVGYPIEK